MPNQTITTDDMRSLVDNQGWTPEAAAMLARFVAAGMDPSLAAIAVKQYMGMNTPDATPEQEWDKFEREQPIRANTKKLMIKAGRAERRATDALGKSFNPIKESEAQAERISAMKMLKDYVMMQDQARAGETMKNGLWMMARMPGAPLAGQPVYGGPALEGPLTPLTPGATSNQAQANNEMFVRQNRGNWK